MNYTFKYLVEEEDLKKCGQKIVNMFTKKERQRERWKERFERRGEEREKEGKEDIMY